jgi:hypothetical protein
MDVDPNAHARLGTLLLFQSGATLFRSLTAGVVCLFFWGVALLLAVSNFRAEVSFEFLIALVAIGTLFLAALLFGYLKSVTCYERGVVVRNVWKSQSVLFSEVVAIQYLAVHKYTNGIFEGTVCHFEIIPAVEDAIRVRILGSKRDSNRLWKIVEIILRANPEAKLLEWN